MINFWKNENKQQITTIINYYTNNMLKLEPSRTKKKQQQQYNNIIGNLPPSVPPFTDVLTLAPYKFCCVLEYIDAAAAVVCLLAA